MNGNVAGTGDNLRRSESLLRIGIASELVHQCLAVFLVLALHRLFKRVDENLSRQMVILGAIAVARYRRIPKGGWRF